LINSETNITLTATTTQTIPSNLFTHFSLVEL